MKLLSHLLFSVWAIERSAADANLKLLVNILKGYDYKPIEANNNNNVLFMNASGQVVSARGWDLEDIQPGTVAIVNLTDVIYKYSMMCGPAGMITVARTLTQLDRNENVVGIILNIDSPGGEGSAARLMFETISSINKPVIAYVSDLCASAGMYIASACDHIVANNKLARVGSIGTYVTIADYTKALEMEGIKIKDIYADQSTEKNQDYLKAVEYMNSDGKAGSIDSIKALVNRFNAEFLADVENGRGNLLKNDSWKTGKMFFADEAAEIGLIDSIDTLDNVVNKFFK
jgi:protease-4